MADTHLQVKIFQASSPIQLQNDVNEFLHPMAGARIGKLHFAVTQNGLQNIYTCMVTYIELDVDPDKEIQLG